MKTTPASHEASMDDEDQRLFIAAQWVLTSSEDEITETQLIQCVERRSHRHKESENLQLINEAVNKINMKMQIRDAEDRI